MDFISLIKIRVPTDELFRFYGLIPNRSGFVICPFHNEKTASMKVYDGDRGYHCFGCGAHGNVVDFVKHYFGLSFREAQSKINEDFCLGLPINTHINGERLQQLKREAEKRRKSIHAYKTKRKKFLLAYEHALGEWVRLDLQRRQYRPKDPSEKFHPLYLEAVQNIDYAEYLYINSELELESFDRGEKNFGGDSNRNQ